VSPAQKAELKVLADRAGVDVSTYVLSRALPAPGTQVSGLIEALGREEDYKFALAGLSDALAGLPPAAFEDVVRDLDVRQLSNFLQNYVSAMVEHAAHQKGVSPPRWTGDVVPLESPFFAVSFRRLRPHLLRSAPVAFKRRNLFVDAAVGDRV
jgi:hypothetical protein